MCSATSPGWRRPAARISGSETDPSPPIAIGIAPASSTAPAAASIAAKLGATRPGVQRMSPQSTAPSRASGSKSACVAWKRRSSADCRRTDAGPCRAPTRNGCVPQSNGTPRKAARQPGPGIAWGIACGRPNIVSGGANVSAHRAAPSGRSVRMQAARCPSPTTRGGGTPSAQAGSTQGQRVRNTQPEGGSAGDGGSPASRMRARAPRRIERGRGRQQARACRDAPGARTPPRPAPPPSPGRDRAPPPGRTGCARPEDHG